MKASLEKIFTTHVQQHKGILYKVVRLYADHPEDREDLQQEIMIQLWKSYPFFKGESAFSSWMYRVALNTALTFFKKEKRRSDNFSSSDAIKEPIHEEYSDTQDQQMKLFYRALQEVNPIEKALMLYFMEGLSHREIGIQLGISEGNARVKLNRTKEKLQQIIKKYNYEF